MPYIGPATPVLNPTVLGPETPSPDLLQIIAELRAAGLQPPATAELGPPPERLPSPGAFERVASAFSGYDPGVRPRGFGANLVAGFASGLGTAGSRLQEKRAQAEADIAARRARQDAERIQASRDYRAALLDRLQKLPGERAKIPGTAEYRAARQLERESAQAEAQGRAAGTPKTPSEEPLVAIEGPSGPVYVPRSQAIGKTPAKTQQSERPRVPSAAERDSLITDIGILSEVNGIREAFNAAPGSTGVVRGKLGGVGQMLGLTSRQENRLRARVAGLRNQILKARSGGAVTEGEASRLLEELPTTNDPVSAFNNKLAEFDRTYRNIAGARRDVYTGTGVDLSKIPALPKPPLWAFEVPD